MHPTRVLRAARRNLTGFDMKDFLASMSKTANDPWHRHEAWRYEGRFKRINRFWGALPGLGIASVAFAIHCGYEYISTTDEHHEHVTEGHEHGHS